MTPIAALAAAIAIVACSPTDNAACEHWQEMNRRCNGSGGFVDVPHWCALARDTERVNDHAAELARKLERCVTKAQTCEQYWQCK